jgi:hypothetical protein
VVSTDAIPLAAVSSAANVHDTRLFPHLRHLAQIVCAAIGRLYADAAYDSANNRGLCLRDGIHSPTSARWVTRTARGSARSAASSSTIARSCWPTRGWTGARTGSAA